MKKPRLFSIVILMVLLTLTGTIGYSLVEGWGFFDSLYMTVITITTTGFQEVHPLSPEGRMFSMVLLGLGMGVVAYTVGMLAEMFLSIDFGMRRRVKMEEQIAKLKGHVIVCGFGRMGRVICQEFEKTNKKFVVVEKSEALVSDLKKTDYLWLHADAARDETLQLAGIDKASFLVSMIDDDADGLYLVLAARSLNSKITIIARAGDEIAKSRMLRAGANKVILPIVVSGINVAQTVLNPDVEEYLDLMSVQIEGDSRLRITDMTLGDDSVLVGKTLKQAGEGGDLIGKIVMGVKVGGDEFIFKPGSDYQFKPGDCLFMLGLSES